MVIAQIKKGEESLFLLEVKTSDLLGDISQTVNTIYNGRLIILRICSELESLCDHGVSLPPNMVGLLDDQIEELKLTDNWGLDNHPTGGFSVNKDPCGKRNSQQPTVEMRELINKTIIEVKGRISKSLIASKTPLTKCHITDCVSILRGTMTVVYPMGLPTYDPISDYLKGENIDDIPQIISPSLSQLWFANKQLLPLKKLADYIGSNEKSKVVLKLAKVTDGAPGREPQLDRDAQAKLMTQMHRRQEELSKLDEDYGDSYLNSQWADSGELHKLFHGVQNITWRPH